MDGGWFYTIVATLLVLVPLWKICGRTGLPAPISLIALVPGIGFVIVVAILAFARWPNGEA